MIDKKEWSRCRNKGEWICDACGDCGECDKCSKEKMFRVKNQEYCLCVDCFADQNKIRDIEERATIKPLYSSLWR